MIEVVTRHTERKMEGRNVLILISNHFSKITGKKKMLNRKWIVFKKIVSKKIV